MKIFHKITENKGAKYNNLHISLYVGSERWTNLIGCITFQSDADNSENWYAMRFEVNSDKFEDFNNMAKIAKKIKDNCIYRAQPTEILHILESKEIYLFMGENVLMSDKGKYLFAVNQNDSVYTYIVAANEMTAQKQVNKLKALNLTLGNSFLIE